MASEPPEHTPVLATETAGDAGAPVVAAAEPAKAEAAPVEPRPHEVVGLPPVEEYVEESRSLAHLIGDTLVYPLEAIQRGLEGVVILEVTIDQAGAVASAYVVDTSGHRILDDAALDAVFSFVELPEWAGRSELFPVIFRLES